MHGAVTIMYKRLEENLQQNNSSKSGISFNKYLRSGIKQEINSSASGLTMDDDTEDEEEETEEDEEERETVESEDFDDDINSTNGNNNNNRNNSG